MRFDEIKMKIQKGDIITSKKGILEKSPISNKWYLVKKMEYLGNGVFCIVEWQKVHAHLCIQPKIQEC